MNTSGFRFTKDAYQCTWTRDAGDLCVLVIDDLFVTADGTVLPAGANRAAGLSAIREYLVSNQRTKCVAFLDLLSLTGSNTGDQQAITKLLDSHKACEARVLIDCFAGRDDEFVGRDAYNKVIALGYSRDRIAFLTYVGTPSDLRHEAIRNVPVFMKGEVAAKWAEEATLPAPLLNWLGLGGQAPDIEKRLWPNAADCWRADLRTLLGVRPADWAGEPHNPANWGHSTASWFDGPDAVVPHTWQAGNGGSDSAIRAYLTNLFGFSPPDTWFTDTEQNKHLHEHLKYLVGACSLTQGTRAYRVKVGCCVILLAAACELPAKSWIDSFSWRVDTSPFLPEQQTPDQAKSAITTLLTMFECFRAKDGTNDACVVGVSLSKSEFKATLDFPCNQADDGKPTLLSKVQALDSAASGQVYQRYLDFVRASGLTQSGYWPECAVGFKAQDGATLLRIKV